MGDMDFIIASIYKLLGKVSQILNVARTCIYNIQNNDGIYSLKNLL